MDPATIVEGVLESAGEILARQVAREEGRGTQAPWQVVPARRKPTHAGPSAPRAPPPAKDGDVAPHLLPSTTQPAARGIGSRPQKGKQVAPKAPSAHPRPTTKPPPRRAAPPPPPARAAPASWGAWVHTRPASSPPPAPQTTPAPPLSPQPPGGQQPPASTQVDMTRCIYLSNTMRKRGRERIFRDQGGDWCAYLHTYLGA